MEAILSNFKEEKEWHDNDIEILLHIKSLAQLSDEEMMEIITEQMCIRDSLMSLLPGLASSQAHASEGLIRRRRTRLSLIHILWKDWVQGTRQR